MNGFNYIRISHLSKLHVVRLKTTDEALNQFEIFL